MIKQAEIELCYAQGVQAAFEKLARPPSPDILNKPLRRQIEEINREEDVAFSRRARDYMDRAYSDESLGFPSADVLNQADPELDQKSSWADIAGPFPGLGKFTEEEFDRSMKFNQEAYREAKRESQYREYKAWAEKVRAAEAAEAEEARRAEAAEAAEAEEARRAEAAEAEEARRAEAEEARRAEAEEARIAEAAAAAAEEARIAAAAEARSKEEREGWAEAASEIAAEKSLDKKLGYGGLAGGAGLGGYLGYQRAGLGGSGIGLLGAGLGAGLGAAYSGYQGHDNPAVNLYSGLGSLGGGALAGHYADKIKGLL